MTFPDEIAFSGSRELIERELSRSVAQVLHLVPGSAMGNRSLQEVGVDIVLSVAFVRAEIDAEAYFAADLAELAGRTGPAGRPAHPGHDPRRRPPAADTAADIVEEVRAILRAELPAGR